MDLAKIIAKAESEGVGSLTAAELNFAQIQELKTGLRGELPFHIAYRREQALERASYFITEVVDSFYKQHFEHAHYTLCDEVIAPYLDGQELKLDGSWEDPKQYVGFIVLMSRDTFKSSIAGLMLFWKYVHWKLKKGIDCREMYCHEVQEKAIERGNVMRQHSLHNKRFRETFPEFHGKTGEWDKQYKWSWPCVKKIGPTESSFIAYGESSKKTGGHYTGRWVDDWESEDTVNTLDLRNRSYDRFRMMDNLKDRTQSFSPYLVSDTTYHFDGCMKRLLKDGGYLLYEVPAHKGSPKAIFDLCAISDRDKEGREAIQEGIAELERERADDLFFPKRLPWRELYLSAKAQGARIYNCQMLLNPVPEGDQRFQPQLVEAMWTPDLPSPGETFAYVRCDPAISKKREADETSITVGLVDWRAWRWSVDGWVGREKRPTEQVRKMFAFARKWEALGYKCFNIGVEAQAYQEALAQLCRDGVPEREATEHGESVPIIKAPKGCSVVSIKRSGDMQKQERVLQMEGPISRGEFRVWSKNPIGRRLMTQLTNFPFDKDDILDSHRDLWTRVVIPPRKMQADDREFHEEIERIMRKRGKNGEPVLTGTHGTVNLQGGW